MTVANPLERLIDNGDAEDSTGVRLDITPEMLETKLAAGDYAIGGAHVATPAEVRRGHAQGSIVADKPESLTSDHFDQLEQFLATAATPPGLRIGHGPRTEELDAAIATARQEIVAGHKPFQGKILHGLGRYGTGYLIDTITNVPGQWDTIIVQNHGQHVTSGLPMGQMLGMHYDNGLKQPNGWTENLTAAQRLQAGRRILVPIEGGPRWALAGLNFSAPWFAEQYRPGEPDYRPNPIDLAKYCAHHPDQLARMAILWTAIQPDEVAEISPANTVHTGSMFGRKKKSTVLTFTRDHSSVRITPTPTDT